MLFAASPSFGRAVRAVVHPLANKITVHDEPHEVIEIQTLSAREWKESWWVLVFACNLFPFVRFTRNRHFVKPRNLAAAIVGFELLILLFFGSLVPSSHWPAVCLLLFLMITAVS